MGNSPKKENNNHHQIWNILMFQCWLDKEKLKKILFIGGNPWSLINFRGSLIKELKKENF